MSRNYLLSLPFERRSMFRITHVRSLVFFLPFTFWSMALIIRFIGFEIGRWDACFAMCAVMIPATSSMVSGSIWSSVRAETILSSHWPQRRRIYEWLRLISVGALELAAGIGPMAAIWRKPWTVFALLPALMAFTAWRYSAARKAWIGSESN